MQSLALKGLSRSSGVNMFLAYNGLLKGLQRASLLLLWLTLCIFERSRFQRLATICTRLMREDFGLAGNSHRSDSTIGSRLSTRNPRILVLVVVLTFDRVNSIRLDPVSHRRPGGRAGRGRAAEGTTLETFSPTSCSIRYPLKFADHCASATFARRENAQH